MTKTGTILFLLVLLACPFICESQWGTIRHID